MSNGAPPPRIHDPSARPPECPFQAAAVPQQGPGGAVGLAFVRGFCTDACALYDRGGKRTCLERVLVSLGTSMAVPVRTVPLPPLDAGRAP